MTERLERAGVDPVLELSETNADRGCSKCDRSASYYVYSADVVSKYVCDEYLEDAVQQAQA